MAVRSTRALLAAKGKALFAHLGISLLLVAAALALILLRWFPQPFFTTDGAGDGLKLIVLVDLVLGPLLTFVVFNPAKQRREIVLDLSLIGAAQLIAYAAGLWSIHGVRIEAVAFHDGGFTTVSADKFKGQIIEPAEWRALGDAAPYLVDVREPVTAQEQAGVTSYTLMGGLDAWQLAFLYQPFAKATAAHRAAGWRQDELRAMSPPLADAAARWLDAHGGTPAAAALRYYPVTGYATSAVLVVDADGRRVGGFTGDLKPKSSAAGTPATSSMPASKPVPGTVGTGSLAR